jgi:hypothetical protein
MSIINNPATNLGNGQVAASAAAIASWTGSQSYRTNATFANTSSSLTETLVVTVLRAGGTARRVCRAVLAPNEHLVVTGIVIDSGDTLKASTTDATTVDYDVSVAPDSQPFQIMSFDANGALKQVNTGVSGNLSVSGFIFESATNVITAHSGGGQGSAVLLTSEVNRVSTVAAAGDSVLLPVSAAGLTLYVINSGANSCNVFPQTGDTIDGQAANTAVAQMANSIVIYSCSAAGAWSTEGLATGFGGIGLQTMSFTPTITAHSGGGQGSAVALTSMINRVSTAAAQGDSVALPVSAVGLAIMIVNHGANPIQVFGSGTETINGIATATGISQGVNTTATYVCSVSGNWEVPLSSVWSQTPVALTTNGAIPPHVPHTYAITKAGVLADTLAAPTAGTDDGIQITITSDTANAHTLTATGLLDTGTASVNVATFAAQKGAGLTLMAYNARWKVLSSVGITFS